MQLNCISVDISTFQLNQISLKGIVHRIIDDRIEKSIKGRQILHNLPGRYNSKIVYCVGLESRGRGAGSVLPWRTLQPPPFPTPGRPWGKCVICGCRRAGTTARGCRSGVKGGGPDRYRPGAPSALMQIVPNLSSFYTLFYSVIYNSVE